MRPHMERCVDLLSLAEYVALHPPLGSMAAGEQQWSHEVLKYYCGLTGRPGCSGWGGVLGVVAAFLFSCFLYPLGMLIAWCM